MNATRLIAGRPWAITEAQFDAIRIAADRPEAARADLSAMLEAQPAQPLLNMVNGVPEFATKLYELRGRATFPLLAVCDGGTCASAAYWIASQADEITVSEGSEIGSLGVIASVYDFSRYIKNAGVDPYIFRSDDLKGAGGDGFCDAHGREIQGQVARYTQMFRDAVTRGRGLVTTDARVLVGADAVAAGYADELGTLDSVIARYGKP